MNNKRRSRDLHDQGFTLIEVIITLVVLAVLASMLVTAMGTSLNISSSPITRLRQTMSLQQAMENIRANFDATNNLATLTTAVGTGQQNNSFGIYEVVDNKYIKFSGYSEVAGITADGILKVTIKDQGSGLALTELFVSW
jgi:prepilin-type N-terminal cleavage/methylation domain-containing protein